MQLYGNVATLPARKVSKSTGKAYWELRVAESQAGVDSTPTWYTVRLMSDKDPCLKLGDFVRVTGKLKADFYLSRTGEPTGTLLVIAFEASKRIKNQAVGNAEPQTSSSSNTPKIASETENDMAPAWSD